MGAHRLPRSLCVTDYVLGYLSEGTLPPEGTICPANPNPFVEAAAASASLRAAPPTPLIRPAAGVADATLKCVPSARRRLR